jgi:signal recognition particle receptor subunit beta
MPYINYENKEIAFKIVYYGPGMSGKTTNLVRIHESLAANIRGDLVTLDTEEERTLFFDFFPLDLGCIEGFKVRFNMYTIPGQIYYEASRRLMLDGADGVVFVADSQPIRYDYNIMSYQMMNDNLRSYGVDPKTFPVVLQYNKRDIEDALALGTLEKELELRDIIVTEAVAVKGKGVMETIREITRLVIKRFEL